MNTDIVIPDSRTANGDENQVWMESCDACKKPLPKLDTMERNGWLTGTLRRFSKKKTLCEILDLVACPNHHVYTVPRQLGVFEPGKVKVIDRTIQRGCFACHMIRDKDRWVGWAIVKLHRISGADDRPIKIEICPRHSVEVR